MRRWELIACAAAVVLPASIVFSAAHAASERLRMYSATSPFNHLISADAPTDPNSVAMIQGLASVARGKGFNLPIKGWSFPVYYASRRTPRVDVQLTASWAPRRIARAVPIPLQAQPDPQADGHLAILDRLHGCEFDFWQARKAPDGSWTASWGSRIRSDGSGVYSRDVGARASGFALLAGLIWPSELAAGRIDHALVFSYPYTRAGGPVAPAIRSDGTSTRSDAIPIGARLQLDPHLKLNTLDLPPYELTIARGLQRYGMFLADTGGAVGVGAVSALSWSSNPYRGILPDISAADLRDIPIERLRVLRLPPERARPPRLAKGTCSRHK